MRLSNKVAIITGAGSGIGQATAERFAEEGAAVVVAELHEAHGKAVAEAITRHGGKAAFVQTDVADEESVRPLVAETVRQFGRIDILVNNAAAFVLKGVDATVEDWKQVLSVNVVGPALLVKHALPELRKAGGGAIVNVASMSSFIAQPQFVTYSSSKAAIAHMTRCLALDLAGDNIRVNAVCPGTIWTPTVERLCREQGLDRAAADVHPEWGAAHMIRRLGEAREVANAILFLASDEASFITATCLMVDGGYTAK